MGYHNVVLEHQGQKYRIRRWLLCSQGECKEYYLGRVVSARSYHLTKQSLTPLLKAEQQLSVVVGPGGQLQQ